jgi:2-C-methyl-D-erythritol 4-phosphate cytidylyltransferase
MSATSRGSSPPDVGVIIAGGGRGERAGPGAPKQFRAVAGVPLLLRALRPFSSHSAVREIVIVLPGEYVDAPPSWLGAIVSERLRLAAGGDTRAASVAAGLRALSPVSAIVLVHDAARPFASTATVDAVIAAARSGVGAVAAVPVADTLKRAGDARRVLETVDRSALWRAQTPQGFPRGMIDAAYARLGAASGEWHATDDSALVAAAGFPVTLVPDTTGNIKVTSPDDFVLAEALAAR